jgi:curved DNA-binding protein
MSDYYQTLGVNRNATPDEIKKAFRSLASKHHPDKGGDTKKFQDIQEAYATLSDPEKRSQYDNPQPQFNGMGGGMPPGFEDMVSQMFGGNNPFFGAGFAQQRQRNRTLNINTTISLEDALRGKDLLATLQLPSGRDQVLEIKIPAGVPEGITLRLSGMGDDSFQHLPRGDIHLTVNIEKHPRFERRGDDLFTTVDISCIDAMLGTVLEINTIDNRTLQLTVAPGTQPGQVLAAAGYGMPKFNDNRFTGRLLISINITVPRNITEQQRICLIENFK